jgi:hypothetical protein
MNIDITHLSRVVRRLDVSSTMRAFLVVWMPLLVLTVLGVAFSVAREWLQDETDWSDPLIVSVVIGISTILFLASPLIVLMLDWAARKDAWRHLAAITGAGIGAFASTMTYLLLVGVVTLVQEGEMEIFEGVTRKDAVVGLSLVLLLLGGWLAAGSRISRGWLMALSLMSAIGVCIWQRARLGTLVEHMSEWGDNHTAKDFILLCFALSGAALYVGFLVWVVVRAIRNRIVLSGDHPRALLRGELLRSSVWVRLAFLVGLPSSLWNRGGLRTLSLWLFIIARFLVYGGFVALNVMGRFWGSGSESLYGIELELTASVWLACFLASLALLVVGHYAFYWAKQFAVRRIWTSPGWEKAKPPILFLRSFRDDHFAFTFSRRNLVGRWWDLWAFRRNADETLIGEFAQYGPVVALGHPGAQAQPFGAARHYISSEEWTQAVTERARHARAIVVGAGDTPGVIWEYGLLAREGLLDRTVLLFPPRRDGDDSNRRALESFINATGIEPPEAAPAGAAMVALLRVDGASVLLTSQSMTAASYVIALRVHFQKCAIKHLTEPLL